MKLQGVGGDEGFETCAHYLVEWEGFVPVWQWLIWASKYYVAGEEALNRFEKIFHVRDVLREGDLRYGSKTETPN
jgi:hypothetical protein